MRYLALLALLTVSTQASAELERHPMNVICGHSEEIISQIRDNYNEVVVWSGKEPNGNLVTMWFNEDKNSFTILKTSPDAKFSCVISAGTENPRT